MNSQAETVAIVKVIDRLSERFSDVPRPWVEDLVWAECDRFAGCPVRNYIPILVERATRVRLKELAQPVLVI